MPRNKRPLPLPAFRTRNLGAVGVVPRGPDGRPLGEGPPGPQGAAGARGFSGAPGLDGFIGETGADGLPGPQGARGDTGAIGPAGLAGPPGAQGDQGDAGDMGWPGPMGPQGNVGPQGASGPQGVPGFDGEAGETIERVDAVPFSDSPRFGRWTQTPWLYGSDAANGSAVVEGTSHATKTTSTVILQPTEGVVGIGLTNPVAQLHVQRITVAASVLVDTYRDSAAGSNFVGRSARGTNPLAPTISVDGDTVFSIAARGYDGTGFPNSSRISFKLDGTIGAASTPGRIIFETAPAGSTTVIERGQFGPEGNLKIGGSAKRATTEGSQQLVLFDGGAPTGTLANGVSHYSSAGEAWVMDAAGNGTQLSPHDPRTGEWIYLSKNSVTGRVLRVDLERLVRVLDRVLRFFGCRPFITEWTEA